MAINIIVIIKSTAIITRSMVMAIIIIKSQTILNIPEVIINYKPKLIMIKLEVINISLVKFIFIIVIISSLLAQLQVVFHHKESK